jgi:hypothetical protein
VTACDLPIIGDDDGGGGGDDDGGRNVGVDATDGDAGAGGG